MFSRYLLCTFTLLVTISVIPHARAADSFDSIQISIFPPDGALLINNSHPMVSWLASIFLVMRLRGFLNPVHLFRVVIFGRLSN